MQYSTVPPWLRLAPSLIGTVTGAPGVAFPHTRLRSGIATVSFPEPFHQPAPLCGAFRSACLRLSLYGENLSQNREIVNPLWRNFLKKGAISVAIIPVNPKIIPVADYETLCKQKVTKTPYLVSTAVGELNILRVSLHNNQCRNTQKVAIFRRL